MRIDTVTERENARHVDGRFGTQDRDEVFLPDLMAAAEGLRRELDTELHKVSAVSSAVRSAMDEALRRHERRVIEVLSGRDRAVVDGRNEKVVSDQGYRRIDPIPSTRFEGEDPHLSLSPKLVNETTSALIAWRGRDKETTSVRFRGGRLRLVAANVSSYVHAETRALNRAQRARLALIDMALAEAENSGEDHEFYDERLAQVLSVFAPRI